MYFFSAKFIAKNSMLNLLLGAKGEEFEGQPIDFQQKVIQLETSFELRSLKFDVRAPCHLLQVYSKDIY